MKGGGGRPRPGSLASRDRLLLAGGLAAVISASWAYLWWAAGYMAGVPMQAVAARPGAPPPGMSFGWLLLMWIVMAGAMMLPTAAPMTMLCARFQRGRRPGHSPLAYTALFAGGYLAAWSVYALAATGAQIGLVHVEIMYPAAMKLSSTPVAAAVLIAAGGFQLTPLKNACMIQCRSPVGFFMSEWRDGAGGAFAMGVHHGLFCVGCCWAVMAIMFVVGAMNMIWVGLLTAFMLIEKLGPSRSLLSKVSGIGLIAAGAVLIAL